MRLVVSLARTPPLLVPLLALILVLPAPARAASYPCEKADAADERAVCDTRALNDLDVEMAVRFDILKDLLPMGGRGKLREDQEAWLAERRTCGADVACLRQIYEARLKTLRGVFAEFAKQGPL